MSSPDRLYCEPTKRGAGWCKHCGLFIYEHLECRTRLRRALDEARKQYQGNAGRPAS